jgi:hypothetical protein
MKTASLPTLLVLCLAGCDALKPPPATQETTSPARVIDEAARAEARRQFGLFLAEAEKSVALLESHPGREALRDGSNRLHDLLNRATEADRSSDKMEELAEEGRTALRYFDACLKVANYQARRKDVSPESAKRFIDKTCDGNLPPFKQLIGMLKTKFESEGAGSSDSPDRPSGAGVQEPRKRNGG